MTDLILVEVDTSQTIIQVVPAPTLTVVEVAQVNTTVTIDVTQAVPAVIQITDTTTVIDVTDRDGVPVASQADAVAGSDNYLRMTPLRTGQAITGFPFLATGTSTARAAGARAADIINVLDNGVTGLGTVDESTAVNALFVSTAAAGQTVWFPKGTYSFDSRIFVVHGLTVIADPNAVFNKRFATSGSNGFVGQSSYSAKVSKISWSGGYFTVPDNSVETYGGNIFALYGDDIDLSDITIDGFGAPNAGGRAYVLNGDRIFMFNPVVRNPNHAVGNGGIRVTGGDGFRCIGGYVESGDDVLQFVPSIAGALPISDTDITNGMYIGCTGKSYSARLIAVVVGNQTANIGATAPNQASVKDCSYIGCKGVGGAKAVTIQNTDSTGSITRLTITNCTLGGTLDTSATGAIVITAYTLGGGIDTVDFTGCSVITPSKTAIYINGITTGTAGAGANLHNVRNIHWDGGRIEAPGDGSSFAVTMLGVNGGSFSNCRIVANGNEAVQVATGSGSTRQCYNIVFNNVTFDQIADAQYGIKMQIASSCLVTGSRFLPADVGTTDSRAVYFNTASPGASYCTVRDCDASTLTSTANLFTNPTTNNCLVTNVRGYTGAVDLIEAVKSVDQSKTSDTTLANDSELSIVIPANTTYEIFCFVRWNQGASALGGIQFQMPTSGGGSIDWEYTPAPSLTAARSTGSTVQQPTIATALNERVYTAWGVLAAGNFDVTLALQWAQQASNGTATTVRQNSILRGRKIA